MKEDRAGTVEPSGVVARSFPYRRLLPLFGILAAVLLLRWYVNHLPVGRFDEIDWPAFKKRAEEGAVDRVVVRDMEIIASYRPALDYSESHDWARIVPAQKSRSGRKGMAGAH